jgi:ATP:ADP antiporter, AAA family
MTAPKRQAIFDVRPGDGRRFAVVGAAMAALLAAHTIAETARDAMFLRAIPSSYLAIVYVALAGLASLALRGNAALVRLVGRRYALVSTLMVASYGTTMFYILRGGQTAVFGLYLWTGLVGTIAVVQFWLLAGSMFTTSEAKRLFGLIAAMGAVGGFLGATLATVLLYVVDVEQLLPAASGFYLLAGLLLTGGLEAPTQLPVRRERPGTISGPMRLRDQPYVARLAIISVLGTTAALVSDYLLKTTAVAELSHDALPSFFARYNSVVSLLSFVLQGVGASLILRRAGAIGAMTLLPLALLLGGAATILTASAFAVIVLTKGADATLKNSVNRVANELLWMPVGSDVRAAIREPLESVVSRIVQGVAAAALLATSLLGLATPAVLSAILVGLAAAWFAVVASLRTRYLSQLRSALMRPAFDTSADLDVGSLELVVEALSSLDDRRVIAAIRTLQRHNRSRLIPALLLRHDSHEVLAVALDAIAVPGRTDWIPLTRRLLRDNHPLVRIAAMRALVRGGDRLAIETGLADADPVVRASAVFWQANTSTATDLLADPEVAALVTGDDDDADTIRRMLVEAIRDDGDPRWAPVVLELARTAEPALIVPLVRAIERIPDTRFLPLLVELLGKRACRTDVRAALLAIGEPALVAVEAALNDPATPPRVRLHLPSTLARFRSQRAGDILLARLIEERSGAVRYRLLRAIARLAIHSGLRFDTGVLFAELEHHLKEHFRLMALGVAFDSEPAHHPSAELVRGLVRDKVSQARDRVFLVLQALHPRDDVRSIERALESPDRAARAHALEFLDTVMRAPIYADAERVRDAILLAYEDLPAAQRVARSALLVDAPRSMHDALARMVNDSDSLLAACAAYHALHLGPSDLATRVIRIAKDQPLLAPLGVVPEAAGA